MIEEVAAELEIKWSRLPPPYWSKMYIHSDCNRVETKTLPALDLSNGKSAAKEDDNLRKVPKWAIQRVGSL